MMFGLLDKFRPKNDTAEALAQALAETEKALAEQRRHVGALEAGRGGALLEGGEIARRHEAALREARDKAERLEALAAALRAKHAEADRQERRAALERQVAEARQKAEAAGLAIAERYPGLAAELIELVAAEHAALKAIWDATMALSGAGELGEGITPPAEPSSYYCREAVGLRLPLGDSLVLPDHQRGAGAPPLWPRSAW
jgi:chromosome segregation ATPase